MLGLTLTALQLSHFRSHRLSRLAFDGRPAALRGNNGAGKTNILEAISLLSPGRGLRRATTDELARRPEAIGWKIRATLEGAEQNHEIETSATLGEARQLRIDDKAAPQVALARLLRVVWLVPAMDRLWIEGAEGRRRFIDRLALSFHPDHAEASLEYERAMRERNRLLKDQISDPHWYNALEARMAQAAGVLMRNRTALLTRLAEVQAQSPSAFPRADLTLSGATANDGGSVQEIDFTSIWASARAKDRAAGRTLDGPHRSDLSAIYSEKSMPAAQCSTGEQKALLISLVLASARALRDETGSAPIILLDEVAAHLDLKRRAALYDEICEIKAQALMTGTEARLFDSLGSRAQHFELSDENGQTAIEEVAP